MKKAILVALVTIAVAASGVAGFAGKAKADGYGNTSDTEYYFYNTSPNGHSIAREKMNTSKVYVHPTGGPALKYNVEGFHSSINTWMDRSNSFVIGSGIQASITHYVSDHPESTFEEYLQNVSLFSAQDDLADGNYVSLMTIHVAKGLEFDNVFVIAMNEGTFQSDRARMEGGRDAEEEERRLAYVAMTRARKNLYLSCNSSYSYVTDSAGAPSMFMKEAGVELPPDQDHNLWGATNWRSNGARFRGTNNGWRKVAQQSSSSFFEDGDAIDPFEKPKPKPEPERPANNGISDWRVGDIAIHEKFGEGVVTSSLGTKIGLIAVTLLFAAFANYISYLFRCGSRRAILLHVAAVAALGVVLLIVCIVKWDAVSAFVVKLDYFRGNMMKIAAENFRVYPFFGTGMGYKGLQGIYSHKTGMFGCYHCLPVQIIGSLGLVGLAAYLFMFRTRVRVLRAAPDREYSTVVFLSYLGILYMSLVNPGIFCPLIYGVQLII